MTAHPPSGGRPLDPDRPTPDDARPTPEPGPAGGPLEADADAPSADQPAGPAPSDAAGGPPPPPPGLRRQLGATRDAVIALVRAHIDLAKAEASEIGGEVQSVAVAVGIAIGALILIAFLVPIGTTLFLGEWLFGSMGWGVLLGTEALVLLGSAAVLGSLGAGRVARAIALAFLAGLLVAILFGTNAPNRLYLAIAEQFGPGIDPGWAALVAGLVSGLVIGGLLGLLAGARRGTRGDAGAGLVGGAIIGVIFGALIGGGVRLAENEGSRPMIVGVLIVGGVCALAGLVMGARGGGGLGGAIAGFLAGFVLGGAVGAFSAITFSWHVAIAVGIALFLGLAIALMLADVASRGIDTEALKRRFYPQASIEMGKETVEWAKARMPRGPRS
jgi:hypothetical protein